jgi:hypothetical protein
MAAHVQDENGRHGDQADGEDRHSDRHQPRRASGNSHADEDNRRAAGRVTLVRSVPLDGSKVFSSCDIATLVGTRLGHAWGAFVVPGKGARPTGAGPTV